ncbi:hypothetical protein ACFXTO_036345 [Malus domestica]
MLQGAPCRLLRLGLRCSANTLVMKYPKSETAEMVLIFHKAARVGSLKVTYEKYSSLDLRGVAAIKPLETLPLRFSSGLVWYCCALKKSCCENKWLCCENKRL